MNEEITKTNIEHFKTVREKGKFAIRAADGGHRSEASFADLLAYAKQLESANCRHVINHLESICEKCGHITTEDGCINCMQQTSQKPLLKLLEMFRFQDMENEFSLDSYEREHYDLIKSALTSLGWKDDKPEDSADLAERLKADRIE